MKKFLTLILVMIAVSLQSTAQESSSSSSSTVRIKLETQQKNNSNHPVHRAPMHINIEAYYNTGNGSLYICYDGETIGEVFLYQNGSIIGYDSDINTSFHIFAPGFYKIEIIGDSWISIGYIQL